MPNTCHFRDCQSAIVKALLATSSSHVRIAIASIGLHFFYFYPALFWCV